MAKSEVKFGQVYHAAGKTVSLDALTDPHLFQLTTQARQVSEAG